MAVAVLVGCRSAPVRFERITELPPAPPALPTPATPASTNRVPAPLPRLAAPPAPRPSTNAVVNEWISWPRWCRTSGLPVPRAEAPPGSKRYDLLTPRGTLTINLGSRLASWDGLEFWLGFPPQWIDGEPYVHALDAQKTFAPLLSNTNGLTGAGPVLVIDPGHGGENSGARSLLGHHFEKEYTLDWATRLQALLVTNGWKVILTRTNDTDLSLSNRVALAEQVKADLFLSLHFNSAFPNE
ncbi:MAG: N-acetylmuramoyl-L-alanine amidase, partial [Verrucomicrobia bacterium]|nr:N-acetylmuramoyl-L-alanine amidase [Verrucomicrobiota bacterium]